MALNLVSLDAGVREAMIGEYERDHAAGTIFLSPRLTPTGQKDYPGLLREALTSGDDDSLASVIKDGRRLKVTEGYTNRQRLADTRQVPPTAADQIAEGDFNSYYIRGLCVRAIKLGITQVEVYRAKAVHEPRPESEALIGKLVAPKELLDDLRAHTGDQQPTLGVPGGPNSGISVRFPER